MRLTQIGVMAALGGIALVMIIAAIYYFARWARTPVVQQPQPGQPANPAQPPTPNKWGGWFKKNWGWIAVVVVGLVLVLWLAPWRTSTQTVALVAPPTGKSVGGPLYWNDSETVKNIQLRNRFTQEGVVDGICFAGFVLPGESVKTKLSNYGNSNGSYRAFLVDFAVSGGKVNSEALGALAVSEHYKDFVARELMDLPNPKKRFEEFNINNTTPEEGYIINEMYVQCEGSGAPSSIGIDREEGKRVHQYVVSIGVNEVSLILPQKDWGRLVIGSVRHPNYQASLKGGTRAIPLEGHENGDFALEAEVNGKKLVLSRGYLFQPQDITNSEIKIRMVMPDGMRTDKDLDLASALKPARVIVLLETT